jgi:hypothetical protein
MLQHLHVSYACGVHLPLGLHGRKLLPSVPHHVIALHMIDRLCLPLERGAATHDIDEVEVVRGASREEGARGVHRRQRLS